MNLYKLYKNLFKRELVKIERELEESQFLPREELEELHFKKFKKLIEYAYENVPYYRKTWDKIGINPFMIKTKEDILKLPILTKEDLMNNLIELKSNKFSWEELKENHSGGTTGRMTIFYDCKLQELHGRAILNRQRRMTGVEPGERRALLWGFSEENKIKDFILNEKWLNAFDLKFEEYVEELRKFKPKLLSGYPSIIYEFVKELKNRNIILNDLGIKSIEVSCELLYSNFRKEIEDFFNCKIYNWYGCREVGNVCYECSEHNGMHINEEHVLVETVENNESVKEREGDLIITTLDKKGMPLIRYDVGDVGIISEKKCGCGRGSRLITEIKGRAGDIILGKNKVIHGEYFTHLFYGCRSVKQFQVIQKNKDNIDLKIVKTEDYNVNEINKIIHEIFEYSGLKVNLEFVNEIHPTKAGKRMFVVSEIAR